MDDLLQDERFETPRDLAEGPATEADASGAPTPYTVKLALFEGPLDLLLHLIQKNELDITAISLALVADQFVEYLHTMRSVRADVIADFLVVAAKLLLIKSRWLLPKPPAEDEEDEEDPGELLARRLREYKRYREAAEHFKNIEAQGRRSFVRVAPPPALETRLDLESLTLDELIAALSQILGKEPELPPVGPLVSQRKVTVREKIELIETLLSDGKAVPFVDVVGADGSRIEIVVSLWAVLEMIKQGRLVARQSRLFGEIVLSNTATRTRES